MKEKIQKAKEWMSDYSFEITYAACIAAMVGMTVVAVKSANKIDAMRQAAIADAIANGKTILPNPDGSFWVLDINQNQ